MRGGHVLGTVLVLLVLVIVFSRPVSAAGGLNCTINVGNTTCPGGFIKLVGIENLTGGLNNSHAQNHTLNTYNNSLCCEATEGGVTLNNSCSGAVVLKLSNETNAHVQNPSINTYPVDTCMDSSLRTPTCTYPNSTCSAGSECLASMASSEGNNYTNAHLGACSKYTTRICCKLNNTAPTNVTLITPINESQETDRTPFFNWTQATDADGDPITYRIQASLTDNFTSIVLDNTTSETNFTPSSDMSFNTFYWRVYSNDSLAWSVSATENFSIIPFVQLNLTVNTVDFGNITPGQGNDTDDDKPLPLRLENLGNVEVNVSINASQLFTQATLNNSNYQYKAGNVSGEAGAFNWTASTTDFDNMTATPVRFIHNLSYVDTGDEAEIDIGVTVPPDEPAGSKQSSITITGESI